MADKSASPEERLAQTELFTSLSKRQLKKLAGRGRVVKHSPGQTIAAEGLGALAFHLILEGEAAVSREGQSIRTLGPNEHFGEISVIDGKPRSVTVEAKDALTTFVLPYQVFQDLLEAEPQFTRSILTQLCARLREAEARH